jgi:hypothetical protein
MAEKGTKCYNNGQINIYIKDGDPIPDGFVRGRYMSKESKQNMVQKLENTCLDKYGTRNAMQNKEIQEKAKKTNLKRYGTEIPMRNQGVKDKVFETNLKRYGFKCSLQNDGVKEKIRQTNMERYGTECVLQNTEIRKKIRRTNQISNDMVQCILYELGIFKKSNNKRFINVTVFTMGFNYHKTDSEKLTVNLI